jgi:RNA polymerase sigma factor (sigma-70 family)
MGTIGGMGSPHFTELLGRAQGGDRDAINQVLAEIRPYMEKIASDYADPAHAQESASDLVQEAWLRAWQRIEQFRGAGGEEETRAAFHGWVAQVVRRVGLNAQKARNRLKRRARDRAIVPLEGGPSGSIDAPARRGDVELAASASTPSAGLRRREEAGLVEEALGKLPHDGSREVLRLCFFDGLSLGKAAERLGLTYDQTRERYHKALRSVEKELKAPFGA